MYEGHWNLSQKPFHYHTPKECWYRSVSQQAAMLRLHYSVRNRVGACLLLGNSGLGKSTILRMLKSEGGNLKPFVQLVFPSLAAVELLRTLAVELCDGPTARLRELSADGLLLEIRKSLTEHVLEDNHPIIAFDDAHQLSGDALTRTVQPLLNLRDLDDRLDFTVILAGQPILSSQLSRHLQLRERIGVTALLDGFDASETSDYIQTRLAAAGRTTPIFTPDAERCLFELSGGNPRRLNRLCDMVLLVGYAEGLTKITAAQVDAVGRELMPHAA